MNHFQIDEWLVEDILIRRNERMAERVHALIQADSSQLFFFALGAGHLFGDRSLLRVLERKYGYQVRAIAERERQQIL